MSGELYEWKRHARKHERRADHFRATLINVRVLIQNGQLKRALELLETLRAPLELELREEQETRRNGANMKGNK
jgi:hypothetical protein